jgi:hypothetical protein
LTSIRGIRRR